MTADDIKARALARARVELGLELPDPEPEPVPVDVPLAARMPFGCDPGEAVAVVASPPMPRIPARPAWWPRAACRGADVDELVPINANANAARRVADRWCNACPVAAQCLDDALAVPADDDLHGIFAGTTPRQRRAMRKANAA